MNKLSFFSHWYGEFTNVYEAASTTEKIFCFGYWYPNSEFVNNRAVCIIQEQENFPITARSALWKISEITVERQNDWLIFSRLQDDLTMNDLDSFQMDCKKFLEHLRSEGKRVVSMKN